MSVLIAPVWGSISETLGRSSKTRYSSVFILGLGGSGAPDPLQLKCDGREQTLLGQTGGRKTRVMVSSKVHGNGSFGTYSGRGRKHRFKVKIATKSQYCKGAWAASLQACRVIVVDPPATTKH